MVASCLKLTAASRQVASPPLGSTAEGVRVEIYRACEGPIEARAQESMESTRLQKVQSPTSDT